MHRVLCVTLPMQRISSRPLRRGDIHRAAALTCISWLRADTACFAAAVRTLCRSVGTSAASSASATSGFVKSPQTAATAATAAATSASSTRSLSFPPPPLSILSWAVDGSGHTHHHCTRRLTMAQRIPLLCETIRRAAPDVVALQDSTAELAAALTSTPAVGKPQQQRGGYDGRRETLKVYCVELAKELQQAREDGKAGCEGESMPDSSAVPAAGVSEANNGATASVTEGTPCSYRLIGRARNGRCGEVQLFVKASSPWEATLLPGMGAGLTVELRSGTTLNDNESVTGSATSLGDERSDTAASARKTSSSVPTSVPSSSRTHCCVLTNVDLSYRGKSLGTRRQGLLSGVAVSAEGSPFTLQASSSSAVTSLPHGGSSRGSGRAPGQLDVHRAVAFEWVHHHIRPDVLVGNMFTGARERAPGFEDAWVRAGSPSGQERTTNTCARHRADHMTNYFYFRPSPGVASKTAMKKMMRVEEEETTSTEDQLTEKVPSTSVKVVVPADAPVGTPLPLNAFKDETDDGAWLAQARRTTSLDDNGSVAEVTGCDSAVAAAAAPSSSSLLTDITTGMPEVAGRFQRCLFRAWARRGPPSRSGHLSAHSFAKQYRQCRVVVLRPMTEVELDAEEQAWHARYITAQYSPMNKKKRQASKDGRHREDSADDAASSENGQDTRADASEGTAAATAEDASRRIARVPSRVRCSLSDQYPLLTLLK